jgi:1,4-alpha-glucan branching enzyme
MKKNPFGVWEVTVPAQNGAPAIPHESKIKVRDSSEAINHQY